jgi:hypothetical protein
VKLFLPYDAKDGTCELVVVVDGSRTSLLKFVLTTLEIEGLAPAVIAANVMQVITVSGQFSRFEGLFFCTESLPNSTQASNTECVAPTLLSINRAEINLNIAWGNVCIFASLRDRETEFGRSLSYCGMRSVISKITSISPTQGMAHETNTITIRGQNFIMGMACFCYFGKESSVSAVVVSPDQIECVVPIGPVGAIAVAISVGDTYSIFERLSSTCSTSTCGLISGPSPPLWTSLNLSVFPSEFSATGGSLVTIFGGIGWSKNTTALIVVDTLETRLSQKCDTWSFFENNFILLVPQTFCPSEVCVASFYIQENDKINSIPVIIRREWSIRSISPEFVFGQAGVSFNLLGNELNVACGNGRFTVAVGFLVTAFCVSTQREIAVCTLQSSTHESKHASLRVMCSETNLVDLDVQIQIIGSPMRLLWPNVSHDEMAPLPIFINGRNSFQFQKNASWIATLTIKAASKVVAADTSRSSMYEVNIALYPEASTCPTENT